MVVRLVHLSKLTDNPLGQWQPCMALALAASMRPGGWSTIGSTAFGVVSAFAQFELAFPSGGWPGAARDAEAPFRESR